MNSTHAPDWEAMYAELQHYTRQHGTACPPVQFTTGDGKRLGQWVARQRRLRKLGQLTARREQRLQLLPGWKWNGHTADNRRICGRRPQGAGISWDVWFDQLIVYADAHGDASPPASFVTESGLRLGAWVARQRGHHNKGALTQERISRLESVPGWTWNGHAVASQRRYPKFWAQRFADLVIYTVQHGHAHPPTSFVTDAGFALGVWVSLQRHKRQDGELSVDQVRRLESLAGWRWNLQKRWDEALDDLRAFVEEHGHASPASAFVTDDGFALGDWVARQRGSYRDGTMAADRIRRLEAMPRWSWVGYRSRWESAFQRMLAYVAEFGDAYVLSGYVSDDGFRLGSWVSAQRAKYRSGRLSKQRAASLQQLPGWMWEPDFDQSRARSEALHNWQDTLWNKGFEALIAFSRQCGHASPDSRFVTADGFKLGGWVARQRCSYNAGILRDEYAQRLGTVQDWVWDARAARWEDGFRHLLEYVDKYGTAAPASSYVSDDGYRLGSWVSAQRTRHNVGRVSRERVERLSAVPGWRWQASPDRPAIGDVA